MADEVTPTPAATKPGIQSTEFYMSVVPLATCCVLAVVFACRGDTESAKWFVGFAMGGGTAYGAIRGFVKK